MRKDFVANISHELRTPLTVISGYLETMLDSLSPDSGLPPVWERALKSMQEQSSRIQKLVANLLLLSKLESAEPNEHLGEVKLYPMLAHIVDDAKALSGGKHQITLECPENLILSGCESELRSAFSNLIFNAVRYTPDGGNILINWQQNNDSVGLRITDDGIGIDPIHIPRLTERFYRIDKSRSLDRGGTGLGLAITKHVLLRHEGSLDIQSSPNEGSQFTCYFPNKNVKDSEGVTGSQSA